MENSKTYQIDSKNKAAFLNKLGKLKIDTSSHDIVDDPISEKFKITINGADNVSAVERILKLDTNIKATKSTPSSDSENNTEDILRSVIKEQIQKILKKNSK